jgi:hypothetical protein
MITRLGSLLQNRKGNRDVVSSFLLFVTSQGFVAEMYLRFCHWFKPLMPSG